MGPQVRDSRRIDLTALRWSPPKTAVSHPNVPMLGDGSFYTRFTLHCDFKDGSTPILGLPRATSDLTQNRFLVTLQLHREIYGPNCPQIMGLLGILQTFILRP